MKNLLLAICLASSLSSCSVLWDYAVLPFSRVDSHTDINWQKLYPDCDYAIFDVDTIYYDSLFSGENYCVNIWKIEHGSHQSPIQTLMFDNQGNCVGAYEFCIGNANTLDVYKDVPIFKKNRYNDRILDNLKFANYIKTIDTDDAIKQDILANSSNYDYNLIVLWSENFGYYMKRHLRQVKKYANKNNANHSFRVLYLKIKPQQ